MDNERTMEVFMDIQRGLPRQGPGNYESTRRALGLCTALPDHPSILDLGCGPGMQSLALAEMSRGFVTAIDLHQEYLDELKKRAQAASLSDRVTPMLGDMGALKIKPGSFDLIWTEGAAYIIGVERALKTWKSLLKPQGYIGLSELLWLSEDPPQEVRRFFQEMYPPMGNIDTNLALFEKSGYRVVGHFTLPDRAWWDDFYSPLQAKLPALREKYRNDALALSYVDMTSKEIELRQKFGATYGYEFFVAQNA